jgi:cytochrome c553
MIRIFAVATLVAGLCSTGNVFANDGKQLYDDFRCTGCHGLDGKGTGANVKGLKPIAGTPSHVTYEYIMKMVSGAHPSHLQDSCNAVPSQEQVRLIVNYVASLPR